VTQTDSVASDSMTKSVTVTQPNRAPVCAISGSPAPSWSGWTLTLKDASSDPDGTSLPNGLTGSTAITVKWGDNSITKYAPGATATHAYTVAGSYTVTLVATDAAGLSSTNTCTYSAVVSLGTVTGTVKNALGNPVNLAKVQITRTGGPNPYVYTNASGVYTITNVAPGAVTVTATSGTTVLGTKSVTVNSGVNTVNIP
jgi:hypothetical protein